MSRRSYGYSSYGRRSYSSYGYRHDRNNGSKKVIIIICIILILAAGAAVGVCAYLGLFNKAEQSSTSETSASSPASADEKASAAAKESSVQAKESSQESSEPEPELEGGFDENVFIYDKKGYEIFYGTSDYTKDYSAEVAYIKTALGGSVNVYAITAPTHSLYGLPEKYQSLGTDEKQNISDIYKNIGKNVRTIDVTATLEKHKSEYIYFGTDHNWTALGAYYAYCDFCTAAGIKPVSLQSLSKGSIKNFRGSLCTATKTDKNINGNKVLYSHPDTVTYYTMPGNYTCTLLENGKSSPEEVPLIATFAEGSNAYSAFIWGDNPYMQIKTSLKTGRKLCIIKDSFGCAFAPFTVNNFDEVYVVDPRFYNGNVIDFIKKNKYTDVLVINSVMTANTSIRTKNLHSILR